MNAMGTLVVYNNGTSPIRQGYLKTTLTKMSALSLPASPEASTWPLTFLSCSKMKVTVPMLGSSGRWGCATDIEYL